MAASKTAGETLEDKKQSKIEDYLTGPRRKRKNFIIMALGSSFDKDLGASIEGYVKKTYPQLSTSRPKTAHELTRQFGRNISLLLIDDNFDELPVVLSLVKALKEKRRSEIIPVLFLTKNAPQLVHAYNEALFQYHESDEYINYPELPYNRIYNRIKVGVDNQNKRRSRRYSVNVPMSFFLLCKDQQLEGNIIDLSVHGALISTNSNTIFRLNDQLKLSIPIGSHFDHEHGDFIKISAKVRRVFISGTKVSVSFEHVTQSQNNMITKLLSSLVTRQLARQAAKTRAYLAATYKHES